MQNPRRDFALANAALERAEKAAGGKTAQVLGTRAITLFESGKQAEGIAMGKEAITACKDPQKLPVYQNFVRVMEIRLKTMPPAKP